ncbi:unnamed protein product [Adineta ricciae]|uniref:Uncharacterized protein n=1 Tax=Adineta ricciae TaxID=249248 RepID=A0A814KMJ6_ADIRI|nr:unnamed protein product [Adineta ricciae]CAF1641704.1 unnamed protein product [Adineta ricciae]
MILLVATGGMLFGLGFIFLNYRSNSEYEDYDFTVLKSISTEKDFKSNSISEVFADSTSNLNFSNVRIQTYTISLFTSAKKAKVTVREAGHGSYHILLLHGHKYSSQIWQKLGTLQYLSKWGYRAVAVDMPKRENRTTTMDDDQEAIRWMGNLTKKLRLSNLVIISPCLSGDFALPYIFQLPKNQKLVRAFVAIAPNGTERFANDDYRQLTIPTLIVHAEHDSVFQPAYELLIQIPNSEVLFMIGAGHNSYVDSPIFFHDGLRKFLYNVSRLA